MTEMNFTEGQNEAINLDAEKILAVACAGSGKTSVLVERARRLLNEGKKLYIVTFTNKATNELMERLGNEHGGVARISTIHKLAMDVIKKMQHKTEYKEHRFINTYEARRVLINLLHKHRLYINYKKLFAMYSGNMDDEELDITWKDRLHFEMLMEYFDKYLKENKLFDVNGIMELAVAILEELEHKIECDAIFVDEFQDVSPIQYEFIKYFDGDHFFVGDPNQSIYAFRGADMTIISQLRQSKEYEKVDIDVNFRCRRNVIKYAYQYIFEPLSVKGVKDGGKVEQKEYEHFDEEVLEQIKEYAEKGFTILMRWNRNIREFRNYVGEEKFEEYNVMTIHKAKGLEFPKVCVVMDKSFIKQDYMEEMRVLHVGATRAEDELVVLVHKGLQKEIETIRKLLKEKTKGVKVEMYKKAS